jgi:succinate dehydrogenase/fumarate reductase flavoprotein subunit
MVVRSPTRLAAEPIQMTTDVLVVGGGVAGCLAATEAAEGGADVLIVDKAKMLERAGSVGGGVDQYLTPMNTGPEWDTPQYLLMHIPMLTDGLVDLDVAEQVVHEMPRMLRKLESIGIDFTDPDTGDYLRTRVFGLPGTYHVNFDGRKFKYFVGRRTMQAGAKLLARTMISDILVDPDTNRAYAAVGFNVRSGEWYVIRANAIIIATGDVNRISRNASGVPFDSWHYPYNTGDGHAMGFRGGAELVNMEFVEATLTPKGFSCQGTNAYAGLGAHFVNRDGERFMFKYDKNGEKARRTVIVEGIIQEVLAGNEPLYVDLRHLDDDVIDHFARTLGYDRFTLPAYFAQKGIDIRTDAIPITVSELSIRRGGVYFRGSGLVVDIDGRTDVEGLYAAGDCSMVSGGIAGAAAMGAIAGRGSVALAERTAALPDVDAELLDAAAERLMRPLGNDAGMPWRTFEDEIRETVTDHVGFQRSDRGLRTALARFAELGERRAEVSASDAHDLMRAHEALNIHTVVGLMAKAALDRTESRSGAAHRRVDYPETDEDWRRVILLRRQNGDVTLRHRDAESPHGRVTTWEGMA